jgi:hypothetical protein
MHDMFLKPQQNNKLGGSLPLQLAKLTQLEELQIQDNLFRPNLPKKIKRGLTRLSLLHHGVYTSSSRKEVLKIGLAEEAKREIHEPLAEEDDDELLRDEDEHGEADQIEAEESLLSIVDKLEQLHGGMAPGKNNMRGMYHLDLSSSDAIILAAFEDEEM